MPSGGAARMSVEPKYIPRTIFRQNAQALKASSATLPIRKGNPANNRDPRLPAKQKTGAVPKTVYKLGCGKHGCGSDASRQRDAAHGVRLKVFGKIIYAIGAAGIVISLGKMRNLAGAMLQPRLTGHYYNEVIMVRLTLVLSVGICVAVFTGCQSMPWSQEPLPPVELLEDEGTVTAAPPQSPALQMAPNQRFKDVPLPMKAKEDLERSYVYESPTMQFGRMVYTIRASVNDIAQFYIDACPAADWQLVSVKQASGGAELLFRKPDKKLEVSVAPLGFFRGKRLILHLVPEQATEPRY